MATENGSETPGYILNNNKQTAHSDDHEFACVNRIASRHAEHSNIIPEGYGYCSYCLNGRA